MKGSPRAPPGRLKLGMICSPREGGTSWMESTSSTNSGSRLSFASPCSIHVLTQIDAFQQAGVLQPRGMNKLYNIQIEAFQQADIHIHAGMTNPHTAASTLHAAVISVQSCREQLWREQVLLQQIHVMQREQVLLQQIHVMKQRLQQYIAAEDNTQGEWGLREGESRPTWRSKEASPSNRTPSAAATRKVASGTAPGCTSWLTAATADPTVSMLAFCDSRAFSTCWACCTCHSASSPASPTWPLLLRHCRETSL